MNNNILDINNLCIKYGEENPVVKNISISIKAKEMVGIVGESGSGKSTLINSILGLLPKESKISSGEIIYKEKNLLRCSKREFRQIRGRRIGMVFQDAGASFTPVKKIGNQFIETIRSHFVISKADAYGKAIYILEKMHLSDPHSIMNSYPFQLSGGMKQRVAIAMVMSLEPEILLADEPTSALDATVQSQVVKQMMELRESFNTSIVMVTHNMGVAAYMCDKIGVMHKGELIEWGRKDEILNTPQNEYTKKLLAAVPELEECSFGRKEAAYIENITGYQAV